MPTLYEDESALDCSGKDSGKDECWSEAVKIAVPTVVCVGFVIIVAIQFIVWPWTKHWILCFFGEQYRPVEGEYESAEDSSVDHINVALHKVGTGNENNESACEVNMACSIDSVTLSYDDCKISTSPFSVPSASKVPDYDEVVNDTTF